MTQSHTDKNINTGLSAADTTYQTAKKPIPIKEGRPNYPEQTEMDNDEVNMEQNPVLSDNPKGGAISIRFLLWQSLLYTIVFTILFTLLF